MSKKKPTLKVKASVGGCFIFTNVAPMVCPRCGVTVPINTEHSCGEVLR